MKTIIITLVAVLSIAGCNSITNNSPMNTIPDVLQVGQNILSRDTVKPVAYPALSPEQRGELARQTSLDVPDSTQLIGERLAGDGITLAAYKVPADEDPNIFKVYLVTRGKDGVVIDALDLREFHTSEHDGPMRFGGNRFHTTDAELRFDGNSHFTLHRVMTLTSIYLKDHSLTEQWRAEWDNDYKIDGDGRFVFKGQKLTYHSDPFNEPIVTEYMSRDLTDK